MREVMITKPVWKEGSVIEQEDTGTFGLFHGFGVDYEECNDGVGTFSVALVEMDDGTVRSVNPSEIKFVERL